MVDFLPFNSKTEGTCIDIQEKRYIAIDSLSFFNNSTYCKQTVFQSIARDIDLQPVDTQEPYLLKKTQTELSQKASLSRLKICYRKNRSKN